jgi:coproporphyrinogen III oxidase-like Fe-S oxidoreductase
VEQGDRARRFKNTARLNEYLEASNPFTYCTQEDIDPKSARFEAMMMGLRLNEGVNEGNFIQRFGESPSFYWKDAIERWRCEGWMLPSKLALTEAGITRLNSLLSELITL